MPDQMSRLIRIGDYVLDCADERLVGPDGPLRIGNKAFRVIEALARSPRRLVTKTELFGTVWDGIIVSDSALTSVIKELRRALRDDRRAPRYIESVYGRGYRLLAEVGPLAEESVEASPRSAAEAPLAYQLSLVPQVSNLAAPAAEHPAISEKPPREAERRLITALSVDLADAPRLSTQVDPEVLTSVLARYRACVTQSIESGGGEVVESVADAMLASFGWPEAREDAAEAAIRAALSIIAELNRSGNRELPLPKARIGIATGLVVAGGEENGAIRRLALAGEAPAIAMRLRNLAAPGTIAISATTHRHVGQLFECEPLAPDSKGGDTEPMAAWRVRCPSAHLSRFRAVRTVKTSFVGRRHELSLIADRWRMAAKEHGRTVVILGEAGIGKSRLVHALLDEIAEQPHQTMIWQCSSYHRNKPLYPAVEYLARTATIADSDPPAEQLGKLAELLRVSRMPLDPNLALFANLLSLSHDAGFAPILMPPNQIRVATIAALVEWLQRIAAVSPLLFAVEDAHWIDATTLEMLTRLVGSVRETPLLAVITARPEFESPWHGRAEVGSIGLDRLDDRDCATLAREIVGAADSACGMVEAVVSRSDGNPLFVEELSAAVIEAKSAATTTVPDSLQSSLMTRLDRLGTAKQVAQVCSVLGRRFARPLLSYIAGLTPTELDTNLALLVEYDVIRPIGLVHHGRYEFKHALLRDAAYESILLSTRRRLHEQCGRSLEDYFPDAAKLEPEVLAQHFAAAGLSNKAAEYAERAGDRATAACAYHEAIASFEQALRQNDLQSAIAERERQELKLLLKLGPAIAMFRGAQAPELRTIYRRAEALSRRAADDHALFKAVWGLWYNANISRELDDVGTFAEQLVEIAEQSADENLGLEALHCRWSSALFRADYRRCRIDSQLGTELYDPERHHKLGFAFGGHDPGVCAFGCLGQAQLFAGEIESGFASVESAIALAERLNHPGSLAHGLLMGLIVGTVARIPGRLQRYVERTLDLSHRFNLPPQEAMGRYHLAWIEAETGDRAKGLAQMEALYDRVTAIGPIILLYKVMYVDQLLRAGRAAAALATADKALADLRCPDRGLALSELLRLRGECLLALGHNAEGRVDVVRAEQMAKRDGAELLRLRAARILSAMAGGT